MIRSIVSLVSTALLLATAASLPTDDSDDTPSVISNSSTKSGKKTKAPTIITPVTRQTAPTNSTGSVPDGTGSVPDGTWPASTGTVLYSKPYVVRTGEVFDGKMKTYERSNVKCSVGEGQKDAAMFVVEPGGTLKNAIIGKNQREGVHCEESDCTIENVWWDDVCEDALSIKGGSASSVTTVTNCGARYAHDKVVQHNGFGAVKIKGFFAQDFGKLYRSCGTCGNIPRKVTVEDVYAINPLVSIVTVNRNYNDEATLKNIYVRTTTRKSNVNVCQWSQGSNKGNGPSGKLCQYAASDVHINTHISKV